MYLMPHIAATSDIQRHVHAHFRPFKNYSIPPFISQAGYFIYSYYNPTGQTLICHYIPIHSGNVQQALAAPQTIGL